MARLLFPAGKVISVPCGVVRTLGRADVARYPEAATVSRVQCIVESLHGDDGRTTLRLTSKGSQNPTLLIPPGAEARDLQQGQSALLGTGDAFSLISTRPDLAIKVQLDPQTAASSDRSPVAGNPGSPPGPTLPDMDGGTRGTQPHQHSERQADPEPCSSQSDAYTSDDGGPGARVRRSGDGAAQDEVSGGAPRGASGTRSPSGGTPSGKKTGRGSQARGVGNGKPPARSVPPVLLLLAGLPGSGKSTFSRELLKTSHVAWVHVNQDAIRGGKPGTREQCIAAARTALEEGACCVVDRCHADAAQRAALRAVASERGLSAHCVALQTPQEVCAKRVASRTDHPGGVQGDGSKRVVFTMAGQMKKSGSWPPVESEGFVSVMDCLNDADATAAVRAWAVYGKDDGGDGTAGLSSSGRTVAATHGSSEAGQTALAGCPHAATLAIWNAHVAKRKPGHTGIMSFFKPATTAAKGATPTAQGASTSPAAKGAVPRPTAVQAVQLPAPGESARGRQAAVAATTAAAAAAAARAGTATAGVKGSAPSDGRPSGKRRPMDETPAYALSLKRLAVDAPNAGHTEVPGAFSSLGGDAAPPNEAGTTVNGDSKDRGGNQNSAAGEGAGLSSSGQPGRNAFAVMMASKSRQAAGGGDTGLKRPSGPSTGDDADPRFKLTAPWAQELRKMALNPEQAQQQVLHKDDQVVMIADAFPKAKHHALVIAREPLLRSIADLRKEHLPLLAHMEKLARKWVQEIHSKDPGAAKFKVGFHAVPSMCQVHMHIVSQDFDSPALKNKKHWNSFTTEFFLPLDAVKSELEARGRLTLIDQSTQSQLEGQELRCHGCYKHMKSMPELKKHIAVCDAVRLLPGLGG